MHAFVRIVAAASLMSLIACSSTPRNEVIFTAGEQAKRTHTFQAGDEFEVKLPLNAGTGYLWTATRFDGAVVSLENAPAPVQSIEYPSNRVGAPSLQTMNFACVAPGTCEIVFEFSRPWEKGIAAAQTHTMTVTVK